MLGSGAWRIGRIGGIEVRVDASWSLLAVLIAYTFYVLFHDKYTHERAAIIVPLAIAAALIFLGSVLLHELVHSWVARARGIEVKGITLFLFGGATQAEIETGNPNDELVTAIVGPLTSLFLAGALWGLSWASGSGVVGFGLNRLAWVNLYLGAFNLIPGFPLDGGRVLRAALWKITGKPVRATRAAVFVGELVGYLLVAVGVYEVLLGNLIGGVWLGAIGWFLARSARASLVQFQVRRALAKVPASQVMSGDFVSIPGTLTLQEAVDEYFLRYDYNAFPVRDGDRTAGIVTLAAIRHVHRGEWGQRNIDGILVPLSDTSTASPSDPMDKVLDKLSENDSHFVMVVEGGTVVGMITPRDLARWIQRHQQSALAESMPES